jgi:hypothetical protein
VVAVFNRSYYLESNSGLICLGLSEIGDGPLNILLQSVARRLPLPVLLNDQVRLSVTQLISPKWSIDTASAVIVAPVTYSPHISAKQAKCNLHHLSTLSEVPARGFAFLLGRCHVREYQFAAASQACGAMNALDSEFRALTSAPVSALKKWLGSALEVGTASADMPVIGKLAGAGPGLTPSGDDLLAGVMLALHRLNRAELATVLWQQLAPMLPTRTNAISAAHLGQAAIGQCNALMHLILSDVMASGNWQELQFRTRFRERLNTLGATSGWDTLAGACLVLDAWLEVTQ